MFFDHKKRLTLALLLLGLASVSAFAQAKPVAADGSDVQRLDVMRDKLDRMRRSLNSAITVLREEAKDDKSKKDDEKNVGTPLGRLVSLEKETGRLVSEVSNVKGKVDKGEKYDRSEVGTLEQSVAELQTRFEAAQLETATARAKVETTEGKARDIKKKKKFLGIFGGGGNDEFDELIGSVSPGRDRELFIVATREIRHRNYDVGRLLFQTIITTYPDSPYLPMSKLAVGDSFYLEGSTSSLIQAIGSYQDWLTFFPTHPLSCRVILKIAEAEMRQVGLPDRDATHAKRAETKLKVLQGMQQCKDNTLMFNDASIRLREVQDNLGEHNLTVANYYYTLAVDQKKGGLKGAQSRFREILEKYPDFSFADEVLFKLGNTYLVEEETDQAARYFQQIVRDYPNSTYVNKAVEQLKLLGVAIPEPNPDRAKILPSESPSFFKNFKNEFFGIYPMTIDKNGVLMSKDFDKEKFELIDQVIENQGDLLQNQIPQAGTVITTKSTPPQQPKPSPTPTPQPK
nr:competence protein ComL precursor [uncultured bacterium]